MEMESVGVLYLSVAGCGRDVGARNADAAAADRATRAADPAGVAQPNTAGALAEALVQRLRAITGDAELSCRRFRVGPIELAVQAPVASLQQLMDLHRDDQLSCLLRRRVIAVLAAPDGDGRDERGGPVARRGGRKPSRLKRAMQAFQRELLLDALSGNGWNVASTARHLGIARSHLYTLIEMHALKQLPPMQRGRAREPGEANKEGDRRRPDGGTRQGKESAIATRGGARASAPGPAASDPGATTASIPAAIGASEAGREGCSGADSPARPVSFPGGLLGSRNFSSLEWVREPRSELD